MKLSIIIPQYKESEKMLRDLLNTIENQKGINFDDLEVLIVNDCSDNPPPKNIVKGYSFKIELMRTPVNGGAGIARQYGTERATGEYIMYLDADDCLMSCVALKRIMEYKGNADVIRGKFYVENTNSISNGWTWVHGKFYRAEYLKEKELKFPKELRVNEDAYFNMLAGAYTDKIEEMDEIITFWAKNPNSTTRKNNSEFVVSNLEDFLKGKLMGFRELKKHGCNKALMGNLIDLFVYLYYMFQEIEFYNGDEKVRLKQVEYEKKLAEIIKEFWAEFSQFSERDFDACLSDVYKTFSNYVDYRLHETFDNFRERIYSYEI